MPMKATRRASKKKLKVLRGLALKLRQLREVIQLHPLADAVLWHTKRTSQRKAAQAVLRSDLHVGIVLGGNRSGKTEVGAMLCVAFALGRDHPAVRAWARRNHLDISRIQPGPGLVCASALTNEDSIRVQRKKVKKYLPAGCKWSGEQGSPASVRLPGGGAIIFKSNDQGARAFQGADWHFLWLDEEHQEPIFNEGRMRLADHAGHCVFTMTPLKGKTWVHKRFVKSPEANTATYTLNSRDNPHVPQDFLEKLLASYGPHERAARERGEFVALEGRVFEFFRHLHVVPSFPIPRSWPRFQAWDFGTRNPCAVGWFALDEDKDHVHLFRLHYQAGWTIKQHAEHVKRIESCPACSGSPVRGHRGEEDDLPAGWLPGEWGWLLELEDGTWEEAEEGRGTPGAEWIFSVRCGACEDHPGASEPLPDWRVADSAALGDRMSLSREHGIVTSTADKAIRPGLSSVAERLTPDAEGVPAFFVHDCCPDAIDEFEGYVWKETKGKADDPDLPLKLNDHAMDMIRYALHKLSRARGAGASA